MKIFVLLLAVGLCSAQSGSGSGSGSGAFAKFQKELMEFGEQLFEDHHEEIGAICKRIEAEGPVAAGQDGKFLKKISELGRAVEEDVVEFCEEHPHFREFLMEGEMAEEFNENMQLLEEEAEMREHRPRPGPRGPPPRMNDTEMAGNDVMGELAEDGDERGPPLDKVMHEIHEGCMMLREMNGTEAPEKREMGPPEGSGDRPPPPEGSGDRPPPPEGSGDRPPRPDGDGMGPPEEREMGPPEGSGPPPPPPEEREMGPPEGSGPPPPPPEEREMGPPDGASGDRPPRPDGDDMGPPEGASGDRPPPPEGSGDRPPRPDGDDMGPPSME